MTTNEPETFLLKVATETNIDEMADVLKASLSSEGILKLILRLDEGQADYDFTVKLRDLLTEALAKEDAA